MQDSNKDTDIENRLVDMGGGTGRKVRVGRMETNTLFAILLLGDGLDLCLLYNVTDLGV